MVDFIVVVWVDGVVESGHVNVGQGHHQHLEDGAEKEDDTADKVEVDKGQAARHDPEYLSGRDFVFQDQVPGTARESEEDLV